MRRAAIACAFASAVAAAPTACGDDGGDDDPGIDAPGGVDAPAIDGAPMIDGAMIDADPSAPDANPVPDAGVSSVVIVDCVGVASPFVLTTSGTAFSPGGDISLSVGGVIQFSTTGFHNFASPANAPADKRFRSGQLGHDDTVCLQFTAAGTFPFLCEAHPSMNGNVIVQ